MGGYWARHRLLLTIIVCAAIAFITSFLFIFPSIQQKANSYNEQSIYRNSDIDFIAPEPSFEQIDELPGTHGIDKVFPFFLTKTSVSINGKTRTTTVLLSDQFQNVDLTMYNGSRIIEQASTTYENPIFVDWQFCKDTSAGIGDAVSISIAGQNVSYIISAIYETNSIYDGGAILAEITDTQKNSIIQQSSNNGYSAMYISTSDYNLCQSYLAADYRPLGRLKNRDQFESDEQYQVHYDAIMSSGYSNEITDFRIRENSLAGDKISILVWVGALLAAVGMLCFNIAMSRRGCERVYFTKQCVPKGKNVKPYYSISFVCELLFSIVLFLVFLFLRIKMADEFIPKTAIGINVILVPLAVVVAESICLVLNNTMVSEIVKKVKLERQKAKERATDNTKR